MELPVYLFSIPRFTIKKHRIRKLRSSFPSYMVTPISVTVITCGGHEIKDGVYYVNIDCKTVTVLDIERWIKKKILRKREGEK